MRKILDFLVKRRYWIIGLFFILVIVNIFALKYVNINYDISTYLAKGSNTRVSLEIMNSEFESNGNFQLMVSDVTKERAQEIKAIIEEEEGVKIVLYSDDSENYYHDGNALFNIFLKYTNFDKGARVTVNNLKDKLKDEKIYLSGGAIDSLYLSDAVNEDMYMILLSALVVVFIILVINSVSWIEPVVFMIVIGVAITINLGTNALLPSISFVTGSICAVMQLALAMDYSIMLLHRYIREKEANPDLSNTEVVKIAVTKSIMPILSSGLTTIGGLLALVFMNFKIGFDIGIVLSKGIVISLIVVLVFMPGLLVVFSNLINKTRHRNLYQVIREKFPRFENKIARYQYKSRYIAFGALAVLIIVGLVFYLKTNYIYTLESSTNPNSIVNLDKKEIEKEFGIQNSVVVLLPKDAPDKQKEVTEYLENYEFNGSNPFTSIQSATTSGLKEKYTALDLANTYGLPLSIIEEVYSKLGNNEEHTIQEVLKYLHDNAYIINYTNDLQNLFDNLYKVSLVLDDEVNSTGLAETLKEFTGLEFSESNASALINKVGSNLTYKEFILKINQDKTFDEIYNEYLKYVETSETLEKLLTKEESLLLISSTDIDGIYQDNDKLLFKDVLSNIDSTKLDESELAKYNYYLMVLNTKDLEITKDEVLSSNDFNYNIMPSVAFIPAFLLSNTSTNLLIQKSLCNLLQTQLNGISDKLDQACALLDLVNMEMDLDTVSASFGLPSSFISPIYVSLNKDKLTGIELLSYIKDNNYIKNIGNELNEQLEEAYLTVDYAYSMFESDNYSRIILNLKYSRSTREAIDITKNIGEDLKVYYDEYYIASECSAFADFEDTFGKDSIKISVASLCFILVIIAISFRSISIPIILTMTIQGAIWLTMAISVWTKSDVYFICYLMIVCIQMGTTIDYGILYTSKYVEERKTNDKETSLSNAFQGSITTILTSGTILVVASFIVGIISQVSIISSIGFLLSMGTLISLSFILLALPQVLIVSEGFIEHTTFNCHFKK